MTGDKNPFRDGYDRRGMLKCLGWAGTGALFTMSGGVAFSKPLHHAMAAHAAAKVAPFSFVQISDTHVGFSKPANPDPIAKWRF